MNGPSPGGWRQSWQAQRRARLDRIRIFYEPGCGFCRKTALMFRKLCLSPGAAVLPADEDIEALALLKTNNSWVVYDADGQSFLHWRAVAYILKQNPFLWILGALTDIPPLRPFMKKFYNWIGAHRPLWSKLLNYLP